MCDRSFHCFCQVMANTKATGDMVRHYLVIVQVRLTGSCASLCSAPNC